MKFTKSGSQGQLRVFERAARTLFECGVIGVLRVLGVPGEQETMEKNFWDWSGFRR